MTTAQTRGRLTLVAIAAIFALPIALAIYFYFSDGGWRPGAQTQHGELVAPPKMLPDTALVDSDPVTQFREVWSLVVLTDEQCAAACEDALVKIRQVRLALGPKMTRMQTVLLSPNAAELSTRLAEEHPRLIFVGPPIEAELEAIIGPYSPGQIFLVDPFGNLMMTYSSDKGMGDIRSDVGKLFLLSNIG